MGHLIISIDNEIKWSWAIPRLVRLSWIPSEPPAFHPCCSRAFCSSESCSWNRPMARCAQNTSDIRYPWREGIICCCHLFHMPRLSSACVPCCPGTYSIAQASFKFTEIFLLQPPEDLNEWTELPCQFKWVLSSCGLVCLWSSKRKQ